MTPLKLRLHNFLSYKEPNPLDFSAFDLAVLSGNNGVGKSSILEAITWAIWGKTRAASDDELIHQGTNNLWVEFVFEHEKSYYRIFRRRELKKTTGQSFLEFQTKKSETKTLLNDDQWESIAEATLKSTQEKIVNILKVPYEIFINSSYLRQGHADEFTIKTPAERKEILGDILGLGYYEELSMKAREKARERNEKNKLLAFQIDDLKSQVDQKKDIENQYKQVNQGFKNLDINLKELKRKHESLEKDKREYELTNERLKVLREKFQEIQRNARDFDQEKVNLQKEKNKYEEQLKNKKAILKDFQTLIHLEKENEKVNAKYHHFNTFNQEIKVLEHIENELANNTKRLAQISTCPMCLRPMSKNEAQKIINHIKDEFKEKYESKFKKLKKDLVKLNYRPDLHQKIQEQIKNLAAARDTKEALGLAENNLKNATENLKKIHFNFQKIKADAQKITQEGIVLKKRLTRLEKSSAQWKKIQDEETMLNGQILEIRTRIGGLKQELVQIEKQEKELKLLEKKQETSQKESQTFEELTVAFGKKGIQAMIIESSIATIEEGANELLGRITDGRMRLRFVTQKSKKTAEEETIETLEILISDELGSRSYDMYSGGEAFRINFAIRIALSKLLAARSGIHLRFLAIDEGFGMLDVAGRDDLVAVINSIKDDFDKIIVITHIPELKDLFPTKIGVSKDENGSQIEMAG